MRHRDELMYQTVLAIYRLLDERLPLCEPISGRSSTECDITTYTEEEQMTVKEAMDRGRSPKMNTKPLGQRTEIDITAVDPTEVLYTIRESYTYLVISRSTLDSLRSEGYLTDVKKGRAVRLILRELEELKMLYSIPKGKI